MGKTTSKKTKNKKYTTRLEKNKRIYYKNNSSVHVKAESSTNKLILIMLVTSIFVNAIFLVRIDNLSSSIDDLNYTTAEDKKKLKSLTKDYTNYLFLGDSITQIYDLDKYFKGLPVVNSGISGNTTEDISNDMKGRVYNYNPSKVFLLIGTNDFIHDISIDDIVSNIEKIISEINDNKPQAEIYVESIYPVNNNLDKKMVDDRNNDDIMKINKRIKKYCEDNDYIYINMYDKLLDEEGNFNEKYTYDGLHPNERGYEIITKELNKYLD